MKQYMPFTLFFLICSVTLSGMEYPPLYRTHKRKLSADQIIKIQNNRIAPLNKTLTVKLSNTSRLDRYKCAFILGKLKPTVVEKLYRKIPHEMGALLAQKKHIGQPLTLAEELEVWRWQTRMTEKYKHKTNPEGILA